MMDSFKNTTDTASQVAIYVILSCLILTFICILLYLTCSKRYKLNWYEKNLLETAKEDEENDQSQEVLVNSTRSLNRNVSPCVSHSEEDPSFWVVGCASSIQDVHSDDSEPDKQIMLTSTSPARQRLSMQAKLDHTKIDTSLYQQNSPQSTSVELRGNLHFTMLYDPMAGILTIRLIEAQDLQPKDFSGTADPYAKVRLLPDTTKTNMWQTRIHKRTLNPVFDEDFVFEVRPAIIGRKTLEINLYDFDAYSRHVCIGGLKISLAHVDLSDKIELWKSLGPAEQDVKVELGDLMTSLSYLPSAERLTVVVIKARNLRVFDDTRNSSDPYVKVSLIQNGKRLKKKKTTTLRNTTNPIFNEALTFDIAKDVLKKSYIEFLVMHDSLLGANEVLGKAILGNTEEHKEIFDEMFRTKTVSARWISLSDSRNFR